MTETQRETERGRQTETDKEGTTEGTKTETKVRIGRKRMAYDKMDGLST
jgi:hypothetical protein